MEATARDRDAEVGWQTAGRLAQLRPAPIIRQRLRGLRRARRQPLPARFGRTTTSSHLQPFLPNPSLSSVALQPLREAAAAEKTASAHDSADAAWPDYSADSNATEAGLSGPAALRPLRAAAAADRTASPLDSASPDAAWPDADVAEAGSSGLVKGIDKGKGIAQQS